VLYFQVLTYKNKLLVKKEFSLKCIMVNNTCWTKGIGENGGENMEHALTAATWFWLFIPMPLLIVLSIVTYFTEGRE
jgi:hypothetical protein